MHASQTNAFNLDDDLVEPFRPFVDVVVHKMTAGRADLTADPSLEERRALAGLLQGDCRIGAARTTLLVATEQTAESLVRAMEGKSPALLLLPSL